MPTIPPTRMPRCAPWLPQRYGRGGFAALRALFAVAALFPIACGASDSDADTPRPAGQADSGAPTVTDSAAAVVGDPATTTVADSAAAMSADTLRVRVEAPDRVAAGAPVPMSLIAENVSGRALDLYLRGRIIAFDLIVRGPEGEAVWHRLEGEVIPAILRIETLAPDSLLRLTHTWDQRSDGGEPVPPGAYTLRGELLTEGDPLVTPQKTLRIGIP